MQAQERVTGQTWAMGPETWIRLQLLHYVQLCESYSASLSLGFFLFVKWLEYYKACRVLVRMMAKVVYLFPFSFFSLQIIRKFNQLGCIGSGKKLQKQEGP